MAPMTARQHELWMHACGEIAAGRWMPVDGKTIRWSRQVSTPDYAREPGRTGRALWPEDTYTQRVFMTFLFGSTHRSVLVRIDRAPWVEAQDRKVTLDAAENILRNPELELDR